MCAADPLASARKRLRKAQPGDEVENETSERARPARRCRDSSRTSFADLAVVSSEAGRSALKDETRTQLLPTVDGAAAMVAPLRMCVNTRHADHRARNQWRCCSWGKPATPATGDMESDLARTKCRGGIRTRTSPRRLVRLPCRRPQAVGAMAGLGPTFCSMGAAISGWLP